MFKICKRFWWLDYFFNLIINNGLNLRPLAPVHRGFSQSSKASHYSPPFYNWRITRCAGSRGRGTKKRGAWMLNVLIACEESQAVCKEFRRLGHRAFSCDIQECSGGHPEWHIQGDVLPIINGNCTFCTADTHTHTHKVGAGIFWLRIHHALISQMEAQWECSETRLKIFRHMEHSKW